MSLTASTATLADLDQLVLREEDQQEVSEGWREAVAAEIEKGHAVAYRDASGALAGLYGLQESGVVWLLCTEVADRYPVELWRLARREVRLLQYGADKGLVFGNRVPLHSTRNRAFIRRLGFRLDGEHFYLPPSHV